MAFTSQAILLAGYLVSINLIAYLAFAHDKRAAQFGYWRISETTLLSLAAAGGIVGSITAQRMLRHKTRKEPFRTILMTIAVLQIVLIASMMSSDVRTSIVEFVQQ